MNVRRSLPIRILVIVVFVSTFTSQAIAGCFPGRAGAEKLTTFTGVLSDYGMGNDIGTFDLTGHSQVFDIGLPMHMNGKVVTCSDPEGFRDDPEHFKDICPD
jgi:hypothetical protein